MCYEISIRGLDGKLLCELRGDSYRELVANKRQRDHLSDRKSKQISYFAGFGKATSGFGICGIFSIWHRSENMFTQIDSCTEPGSEVLLGCLTDLFWLDGFTCHMHVLAEGDSIKSFLSQENSSILPYSATSCQDYPTAVSPSVNLKGSNFYANPSSVCSFQNCGF